MANKTQDVVISDKILLVAHLEYKNHDARAGALGASIIILNVPQLAKLGESCNARDERQESC